MNILSLVFQDNWHIDNLNHEYIELVAKRSKEISEEGIVGGPVLGLWRFKVEKAGETEIKMGLYVHGKG